VAVLGRLAEYVLHPPSRHQRCARVYEPPPLIEYQDSTQSLLSFPLRGGNKRIYYLLMLQHE